MPKKAKSPCREILRTLFSLPQNEQDAFWTEIAQNGAWKGTPLDHSIARLCHLAWSSAKYRLLYQAKHGVLPDEDHMRVRIPLMESEIAHEENDGVLEIMNLFGFHELFLDMLFDELQVSSHEMEESEYDSVLPAGNAIRKLLTKEKMTALVIVHNLVNFKTSFKKKKNPDNEKLEQAIIAAKDLVNNNEALWNFLKSKPEFAELSKHKLRRTKSRLKKSNRLT